MSRGSWCNVFQRWPCKKKKIATGDMTRHEVNVIMFYKHLSKNPPTLVCKKRLTTAPRVSIIPPILVTVLEAYDHPVLALFYLYFMLWLTALNYSGRKVLNPTHSLSSWLIIQPFAGKQFLAAGGVAASRGCTRKCNRRVFIGENVTITKYKCLDRDISTQCI